MKRIIRGAKERRQRKKAEPTDLTTTDKSLRITNSTVAEHREEVLGQARKFRYPIAQARHRIVVISLWLAGAAFVFVSIWSVLLLYRSQSTGGYAYQFTNFVPVPVARVDGKFVSYESYLFELRHVLHYKRTQENLDFNSQEGKDQLIGLKRQALEKVIDDHYVDKLAKQSGIFVSGEDIDNEVKLLQDQQQLGADRSVLDNVLKRYYNWDYEDFRRSIHDQLVRQKFLSFLEKDKMASAQSIIAEARGGRDFGDLAKQYSEDDSTKAAGGTLPPLAKDNRDVPLRFIGAAFKLKPGEISEPVETPYGIEIIKVNENNGAEVKVQHIVLKYRNIEEYIKTERSKVKVSKYIDIPEPPASDVPATGSQQ